MYTYGISDEDIYGRPSLDELYQKGRISEFEYKSTVYSSGALLRELCYWEHFPIIKAKPYSPPGNYTPKGYIRQGQKLINLTTRRNEIIKKAKQKVPCPVYVSRDANGRVTLVRKDSRV